MAPVQRLKARRSPLGSEKPSRAQSSSTAITGKMFAVQGGAITELVNWHGGATIETDKPWTLDDVEARIAGW